MINAGGDANIIGSQVKGKRVEVNAQNLNTSQSGKLENRFNKEVMDNYSTRVR